MKNRYLAMLLALPMTSFATTAVNTPGINGAFYPMYNQGANQYLVPNDKMPFEQINFLYLSFAHVYPEKNGAIMNFEKSQPDEINRLPLISKMAKKKNPQIKLIISLGYDHDIWKFINADYKNHAALFVPSVINFIRQYKLDGLDIDDEDSLKDIPAPNFDAVVRELRTALDQAGKEDGKKYYLTITPAFGQASLNKQNINLFDLINTQNYGDSYPSQFVALGYPKEKITQGLNVELGCTQTFPDPNLSNGMFTWSLSADSVCDYKFTSKIYKQYPPRN